MNCPLLRSAAECGAAPSEPPPLPLPRMQPVPADRLWSSLLERSIDLWVTGDKAAYHFQALMLYEKVGASGGRNHGAVVYMTVCHGRGRAREGVASGVKGRHPQPSYRG